MKQYKKNKAVLKRLRSMKKRIERSLALVGIFIITMSLSGCEKSVEADISAEAKIAQSSYSESEVTVLKNGEKPEADVLFEEMLSDIEISGQKLSLPCSSKDLGLDPYKECPVYYDDDDNKYHYIFGNPINEHIYIDVEYRSDKSDETILNADKMYYFYVSAYSEDDNDDYKFRFGPINNYSNMTQNYVESLLGKPNEELYNTSWYELDNSRIIIIHYNNNSYVTSINCYWR